MSSSEINFQLLHYFQQWSRGRLQGLMLLGLLGKHIILVSELLEVNIAIINGAEADYKD